jgi:DHA2 family multidrug resistance protein-like MFS transporter
LVGLGRDSLAVLVLASVIISIGFMPVVTLATELIVGSAPPEHAGAATGISETSGELGGALGIAVLGSLGTVIYRTELGRSVPLGIPHEAVETARSTLGAALTVAAELPSATGAALLDAAYTAFIDAIHLVAAVSAIVAVIAAISAATLLRHVPARSHAAESASAEAATA